MQSIRDNGWQYKLTDRGEEFLRLLTEVQIHLQITS